jgi:hypothetical protein
VSPQQPMQARFMMAKLNRPHRANFVPDKDQGRKRGVVNTLFQLHGQFAPTQSRGL